MISDPNHMFHGRPIGTSNLMSPIDQAIFDTETGLNDTRDIQRIIQEPLYRKVSQSVLKDFNQKKIGDIENKYSIREEALEKISHN